MDRKPNQAVEERAGTVLLRCGTAGAVGCGGCCADVYLGAIRVKNIETMAAELVAAVERDWPSSPEHRARVLKAADALSLSLAQASKRGMTTPIKNYGPEFLADLRAEAEAEAQAEAKPAEPSNPVTVYTNRGAAPAAPGQQEAKSVLELLRKARAVIQPDWEDATGEPLAQWCTDADAAIAAPQRLPSRP